MSSHSVENTNGPSDAGLCPQCRRPLQDPRDATGVALGDAIYVQILNQSALLVGMCFTLLGLFKVVEGVQNIRTLGDEMLAIGALTFLAASGFSYGALKESSQAKKKTFGRIGDRCYSAGLIILALLCVMVAVQLY